MTILKDAIAIVVLIVAPAGMAAGGFYAAARPTYDFPDEASLRHVSSAAVEIGRVNQYKYGGAEVWFRLTGQDPEFVYIQRMFDESASALTVEPMLSRASAVSFRRAPSPEPGNLGRFRAYDLSIDGRTVQTYARVREALIKERRIFGTFAGVLCGPMSLYVAWTWLKALRAKIASRQLEAHRRMRSG